MDQKETAEIAETFGKLIWATPFSVWWPVAVWPFLMAAIYYLYRGELETLSVKVARILLTLRCTTGTLLLVCLLQPVWQKRSNITMPRLVPVMIDNTVSMHYPDPQRKPVPKIRLAERLEFFEPELRFKYEQFFHGGVIANGLDDARKKVEKLGEKPLTFDPTPTKDQIKAFKKKYKHAIKLFKIFTQMSEKFQDEDADLALLSDRVKEMTIKPLELVTMRLDPLKDRWDEVDDEDVKFGRDFEEMAEDIMTGRKDALEFLDNVEKLQYEADLDLSDDKNEKIREAMDKITRTPRMELVWHILNTISKPVLPQLEKKNKLSPIHAFGYPEALDKPTQYSLKWLKKNKFPQTDFDAELSQFFRIMSDDDEVRQIVLITDGRDFSGKDASEFIEILNKKEIKMFILGVGDTDLIPDVGIVDAEMPSRVFQDDTVQCKVIVKWVELDDRELKVRILATNNKVLAEKPVPKDVKRDAEGKFFMLLEYIANSETPPARVEIVPKDAPPPPIIDPKEEKKQSEGVEKVSDDKPEKSETVTNEDGDDKKDDDKKDDDDKDTDEETGQDDISENDFRKLTQEVRKDKIQVLFIDEFPRWESRYLNMMLRRDKRIDLEGMRVIFYGSLKDRVLERGDELYQFPASKEDLFKFDLIVIGDVEPSIFSDEEYRNMVEFVGEKGGSMIFLAGENFMPNAFLKTDLSTVIPMEADEETRIRSEYSSMELTAEGQAVGFIDEYKGHKDREGGYGFLFWLRNDVRAIPTAAVLSQDTVHGIPMVVMANYGSGKALYLGSDEFWRWRFRSGWKYHHEFWSIILLWATSEKIGGETEFMGINIDKKEFNKGDLVEVRIKLKNQDGKPLRNATGFVQVTGEDEDGNEIDLKFPIQGVGPVEAGQYRVTIPRLPNGDYTIKTTVNELEDLVEYKSPVKFTVSAESTQESLYIRQNQPFLKRLAEGTGGKYFDFKDFAELPEPVKKDTHKVKKVQQNELWDTWWMILLVTALLMTEWIIRKRVNLA